MIFPNAFFSFQFILISLLIFNFVSYSFGQNNTSYNNADRAKISSDQALSIIDSLKGSSLLDSVVGGMEKFSVSGNKNPTNTDVKVGVLNDSAKNSSLIVIDRNVTPHDTHNVSPMSINDHSISNDVKNIQSLLVLPHPMSIQSKDYIPLYSSMPLKISNGTILAKLPCDINNKSVLQIMGSSADNNIFPIHLNLIPILSHSGNMCMYKSIFPDDLSNSLYSRSLTNIYLYNTLNMTLEVPNTTSIFIGIDTLTK